MDLDHGWPVIVELSRRDVLIGDRRGLVKVADGRRLIDIGLRRRLVVDVWGLRHNLMDRIEEREGKRRLRHKDV